MTRSHESQVSKSPVDRKKKAAVGREKEHVCGGGPRANVEITIDCAHGNSKMLQKSTGIELTALHGHVQVRQGIPTASLAYSAGVRANDIVVAAEYDGQQYTALGDIRSALKKSVETKRQVKLMIERRDTGTKVSVLQIC
jgi:hypothetical protein